MNIVFLDVDGVLNSRRKLRELYKLTGKPHSGRNYPFDEQALYNLKKLVNESDSFIVVTSVWRKNYLDMQVLLNVFAKLGIKERFIGVTPILNNGRGQEIKSYLDTNTSIVNFVILDDDSKDMLDLSNNLVKVDGFYGLTDTNVTEAINILRDYPSLKL